MHTAKHSYSMNGSGKHRPLLSLTLSGPRICLRVSLSFSFALSFRSNALSVAAPVDTHHADDDDIHINHIVCTSFNNIIFFFLVAVDYHEQFYVYICAYRHKQSVLLLLVCCKKRERYSTTSKFGGRAVRRELSFSAVGSRSVWFNRWTSYSAIGGTFFFLLILFCCFCFVERLLHTRTGALVLCCSGVHVV